MAAAAFVEEEVDVGVALPNFSIHQTYLICVNIIISSIVFHLFVRSLFFPTHPRPCHRILLLGSDELRESKVGSARSIFHIPYQIIF